MVKIKNHVHTMPLAPTEHIVDVPEPILIVNSRRFVLFEQEIVDRHSDVVESPFSHSFDVRLGDVAVPVLLPLTAVLAYPVPEVRACHVSVKRSHKCFLLIMVGKMRIAQL